MKVWEEDWDVDTTYGGFGVWSTAENDIGGDVKVAMFADEARATLAAQAPAMARLFLDYLEAARWGDPTGMRDLKPRVRTILQNAGVIPD